jgi:hypothetical protein
VPDEWSIRVRVTEAVSLPNGHLSNIGKMNGKEEFITGVGRAALWKELYQGIGAGYVVYVRYGKYSFFGLCRCACDWAEALGFGKSW